MKKIIRFLLISLVLLSTGGGALFAQQHVDFTLKFNYDSMHYEVYGKPDFSGLYFLGGGSQITVVLPESVSDNALSITSVNGGAWADNSQIYSPAADPTSDFHGIATIGTSAIFMTGTELLLFTFELPTMDCINGPRLFENATDPNSAAAGMGGGDFLNFFADVFDPATNDYQSNYDNLGYACSEPPLIMPNPIVVLTDSTTTVCMPVVDIDGNVSDSTTICGVTAGSATSDIVNGQLCVTYDATGVPGGHEEVCVIVCDDSGLCDTVQVPVTVLAPLPPVPNPLPPVVITPSITVPSDSTIVVCTQILDANPGDVFNVENTCNTPDGTATPTIVGSELCIEYDADGIAPGTDEICLVICDQDDLCDTITVPVTITPNPGPGITPQPPVVIVPPIVVPIDSTINVCLPIIDPNTQDTFNVKVCAAPTPTIGTLNGVSIDSADDQACLDYTAGNTEGADSICLIVCDSSGLCDTVTIVIEIIDPSDPNPPVIVPNPIVVMEDSTTTVCMPVNDVDGNVSDSTAICGVTDGSATSDIVNGQLCVTYDATGVEAGNEEVCVIVCDDTGLCDTVRVPVTVLAPIPPSTVPTPPVVVTPSITVPVDSTITVCTQILDANVGDVFNVENTCNTPLGAATPTIVGNELCIEYDADAVPAGMDEICLVICDQTDLCDTIVIPVTVIPNPGPAVTPQPPVVVPPPVIVPVDSTIEVCLPITDPNPLDTFNVTVCGTPQNGTLNGAMVNNSTDQVCINYTGSNTPGTDSICLIICDSDGLCDTVTQIITITEGNTAPIAVIDFATTKMNDSTVILVQGNDSDPNGHNLTTEVIGQGTNGGTATVLNGDSLSYMPAIGFIGNDTITYRICDDGTPILCDTAIVVITVTVPTLPAVTDRCNIEEGEDIYLNLAGNNMDADFATKYILTDDSGAIVYTADAFPISGVAAGKYFAFSFNYNTTTAGQPNFTPGVNIYGTGGDCFDVSEPLEFNVCACNLQESTIALSVTGQNTNAAYRQLYLLTNGRDSIVDTSSVAMFDELEEGVYNVFALNYEIADSVTNYAPGDFVSKITGNCFDLSDALGYVICNLNEPPVVLPVPLVIKEDSTGTVCMEILDTPGDTFNVTSCGAGHGTETWTVSGSELCLEYTPDSGFTGSDTVCVIVCDQDGACDTTHVPVVVIPAPAPETTPVPPTVIPTFVVVPIDSTVTACTPILDPNIGDTHTATNCPGTTTNGTVTPTVSNGMLCIEYESDGVFVGTENVCIIVCDDASPALCDTVTIPVTVIPLPGPVDSLQAPIVVVPPIVTPEDTTAEICGVIVDPNILDTHSATICQQPSNGFATVSVDDNSNQVCITFDPDNNFVGTDSLCLSVCDSTGLCTTINVPIEVIPSVSELKLRVYLQGAFYYDAANPQLGISDTLMSDNLRSLGLVPTTQPYSEANYNTRFTQKIGGGEVTTNTLLSTNSDPKTAIVDWVFVEMRDKDDATNVFRTYSGLVQRNGDIVAPDGGDMMFNNLPDSFYVSIKHRNHLGAMTANPVGLVNSAVTVDFTRMSDADLYSEVGYDGLEMKTIGNVKALWAGNANQDNKTKYDGGGNDQVIVAQDVLTFGQNTDLVLNYSNAIGYFLGDVNMDGKSKYDGDDNDRILIQGISLLYPLNTSYTNNYDLLMEQIPR